MKALDSGSSIGRSALALQDATLAGAISLQPPCGLQAGLLVDASLKRIQQFENDRVSERQNLREQHASDTGPRIEPVVRIIKAGPGEAAGAPAAGPGLRVDQEAQPPFLVHAWEEFDVVGRCWIV